MDTLCFNFTAARPNNNNNNNNNNNDNDNYNNNNNKKKKKIGKFGYFTVSKIIKTIV